MIIAEGQKWQGSRYPFKKRAVIGVIHLKPLPGSPGYEGNLEKVRKSALSDAAALCEGGVDGLILENFGDAPFLPRRVDPHTVAYMAVIASQITDRVDLPLGINVLRNDGLAGLGVAAAGGARFMRVNVYTGAAVTDQGILEGEAHLIQRYRVSLGIETAVLADVHVKHGMPLGGGPIESAARDAVFRGGADAVVVTGPGTGMETSLEDLARVKGALPTNTPVLAGSGVNLENLKTLSMASDGLIVGTWFKRDGKIAAPVDPDRVSAFMKALRENPRGGWFTAGIYR